MSSINWGDFPTWLTGVATIVAAVAAIVGARAAFSQLKSQRNEIERQGAEQARLAELQTKQLGQLEQQALLSRRSQAEQVYIERQAHMTGFGERDGIILHNDSGRPIREVAARVIVVETSRTPTTVDGSMVRPEAHRLSPFTGDPGSAEPDEDPEKPIRLIGRHKKAYIVWSYAPGAFPVLNVLVRFSDDADVRWQVDKDMHLTEVPDALW